MPTSIERSFVLMKESSHTVFFREVVPESEIELLGIVPVLKDSYPEVLNWKNYRLQVNIRVVSEELTVLNTTL